MLQYLSSNKVFRLALIASFTLGLAPFFPEPHIIGKLRWVAGGAEGMQLEDFFDLFFHGFPCLILLLSLLSKLLLGKG